MLLQAIVVFVLVVIACIQAGPVPQATSKSSGRTKESSLSEGLQCLFLVGASACAKGKTDADTAVAAARETYPVNTLNNGIGDAFRHCYWNALMTISVGRDAAKKIADLHEDHNTIGSAAAGEMDLKNNEIGREVGSQSKTAEEARAKCNEHVETEHLRLQL